jgi:hypothetical protein
MTTHNFEDHPVPDGLAMFNDELIERLRTMAFLFSEAVHARDGHTSGYVPLTDQDAGFASILVNTDDIETLNAAISALGGKPVHLGDVEQLHLEEKHGVTDEEIPY